MWAQVTFPRGVDWEIDNYLVSTKEVRIQKCSSLLSDSTFASCGEFNNLYKLWTRAVESESLKVGKSLKIGKIGSDFLSDFLAKIPKCHK